MLVCDFRFQPGTVLATHKSQQHEAGAVVQTNVTDINMMEKLIETH